MKLNIAKKIAGLKNNDIESWKNVACLQTYRSDVYRDVLENRQVGKEFKLVNPKLEDRLKIFSKYFFLLFK